MSNVMFFLQKKKSYQKVRLCDVNTLNCQECRIQFDNTCTHAFSVSNSVMDKNNHSQRIWWNLKHVLHTFKALVELGYKSRFKDVNIFILETNILVYLSFNMKIMHTFYASIDIVRGAVCFISACSRITLFWYTCM